MLPAASFWPKEYLGRCLYRIFIWSQIRKGADEAAATALYLRGRPPGAQPLRGGGKAVHLPAGRQQANSPPGRRARGRDLRAPRQAHRRDHPPGARHHPRGRTHAAGRHQPEERGAGVYQRTDRLLDDRYHPHPGALRAAARGQPFHGPLSRRALEPAPGQPDADRRDGKLGRGRPRHRHRGDRALLRAGDASLLRVEPLHRGTAPASPAEGQTAHPRSHRPVPDHHLRLRLHGSIEDQPGVRGAEASPPTSR